MTGGWQEVTVLGLRLRLGQPFEIGSSSGNGDADETADETSWSGTMIKHHKGGGDTPQMQMDSKTKISSGLQGLPASSGASI
jgi:hypothetical protein